MNAKDYNKTVDLYADSVYRFVVKHLKNEMAAQDVVQESFMKVWDKHETIEMEKAKSYLFTTAYHCLVDFVKKEKRNGDFESVQQKLKMEESSSFDLSSVLNEALDRLPSIQKTVVLLRDYEGYNYAEIAEITALTESQVKVYIFRARQALKLYLKSIDLVA